MLDSKAYGKNVIDRYRGPLLRELKEGVKALNETPGLSCPPQLDVVALYAIEPTMNGAQIAERVGEVQAVWNRLGQGANAARNAQVASPLLALHKHLIARNPDFMTAEFWATRFGHAAQLRTAALQEFASNLADEYRSLGVATRTIVTAAATKAGLVGQHSDGEIVAAVETAGIRVVAEIVAPTVAVPPGVDDLKSTDARGIIDAIFFPTPPPKFSILEGFRAPGSPPLSLAQVGSAKAATLKAAMDQGGEATGKVLSSVLGAASTEAQLEALVLAWYLRLARDARKSGLRRDALRMLTDTGLELQDAARLLLQVGPGSESETIADVAKHLSVAKIRAARRVYRALGAGNSNAGVDAAKAALDSAEARLASLLGDLKRHLASGDSESATLAATAALEIDGDDEDLRQTLSTMPPGAPVGVVITPTADGQRLQIAWKGGYGADAETSYSVIRKVGQAPLHAKDGTVIASLVRATLAEDPSPPAGAKVWYGVVSSRGGPASAISAVGYEFAPPISDLMLHVDPTTITATWKPARGAHDVTASLLSSGAKAPAVPLPVTGKSTARASGLATGSEYQISVTAHYVDGNGHRLSSPPIVGRATPRHKASAPKGFDVIRRTTPDGSVEVELTWSPLRGHDVEVWRFSEKPGWETGSRVSASDATGLAGTRVMGREIDRGDKSGLSVVAEPGVFFYLAGTCDGDELLVSETKSLGVCLPVTNATAERFAHEIVLAWDWPGKDVEVEARWHGDDAVGTARIDRSKYILNGGLRIPAGETGCTVTLVAFLEIRGQTWKSTDVMLDVPGAAASVAYTVQWPKLRLGGGKMATVRFEYGRGHLKGDVVIVGTPGHVMPFAAEGATVLGEANLAFTPARSSIDVPISIPRLGSAYWIRAFPKSTHVRLTDPPTDQLKGR
jgi:hypothetical protein